MAETIRFRPVIIGEPPDEGVVYYFAENSDGTTFFQDAENPWPVTGTLDTVTPEDVPEFYRNWPVEIRVLPISCASGADALLARDDLLEQIEALADAGIPVEPVAAGKP